MNRIKYLLLLLGFASFSFAGDLEIINPALMFTSKEEVKAYIYKTESYEDRVRYTYTGFFWLRNTSNTTQQVMTGMLSPGHSIKQDSIASVRLTHPRKSVDGSLLVPSPSELKLVTLNPSEVALVELSFGSSVKLTQFELEYSPSDHYADRFQFWTGTVKSDIIDIPKH